MVCATFYKHQASGLCAGMCAWPQDWTPKDGKTLLRSSASHQKYRICFGSGVWVCVEFVITGWSKVKILCLYNLKLEQAMRNLACGDQLILLVVIWLVLRRFETDKIIYWWLDLWIPWTCIGGGGMGLSPKERIFLETEK